jgi:hypothetical protein
MGLLPVERNYRRGADGYETARGQRYGMGFCRVVFPT